MGKLTLGGDWRREIFLVDGTGLASEMGRELGRGGLELEGALLYLNKEICTKKKLNIENESFEGKKLKTKFTHFLSYAWASTSGKLFGTSTKSSEFSGLLETLLLLLFVPSPMLS